MDILKFIFLFLLYIYMPTLKDYHQFVKKYNKEFSLTGISKLTKPKLKKKIEDVLSEQRLEIKDEWRKLHPGEYGQPPAPKKTEPKKTEPKKTASKNSPIKKALSKKKIDKDELKKAIEKTKTAPKKTASKPAPKKEAPKKEAPKKKVMLVGSLGYDHNWADEFIHFEEEFYFKSLNRAKAKLLTKKEYLDEEKELYSNLKKEIDKNKEFLDPKDIKRVYKNLKEDKEEYHNRILDLLNKREQEKKSNRKN